MTAAEVCRMNSLLPYAAFSDFTIQPDNWGDGVSTKMLEKFREAGFDRLRLCVSGWEGIEKRPQVAKVADEMGYLFGTYDSFNGIRSGPPGDGPNLAHVLNSTKSCSRRDPLSAKMEPSEGGTRRSVTSSVLSPLGHTWKRRVRENMRNVPYSYYFVDCDAYGQVYDDYSPLHPAGQADDAAARLARLQWISDMFKVVVGSEGGSAYAAPGIHVAEGIVSPAFGWGDPDYDRQEFQVLSRELLSSPTDRGSSCSRSP